MLIVLESIGIIILAIVIVFALVLVLNFFRYYSYHIRNKYIVDIPEEKTDILKIMSYNIRCIMPFDFGKRSWFFRANLVIKDIFNQNPSIIGFQEVTALQYKYLTSCLPNFTSVITYRDGSIIAEGCPIFYDKNRFRLINTGSFWLSETPDTMSKNWGAAHFRICSYVVLTDCCSNKDLVVFNTHLDNASTEAKAKGIQVIIDKISDFNGLPVIIMGDYNLEEGSAIYSSITECFLDAKYEASVTTNVNTYHNWGMMSGGRRIDYFMISKHGLHVHSYSVLAHTYDGVYASDHAPIIMTLSVE